MDLISRIKSFDAYPKLNEEFKVKTFGGAVAVETVDHLYVDVSRGEKLRINFDVTFPHIPCSLLSLDAMDVSGSHQLDVSHHIKKKPLDELGNAVGEETVHALHSDKEGGEGEEAMGAGPGMMRAAAGVRAQGGPGLSNITMADIARPDYCGPCYGAEVSPNQCCRTCSDVKDAYRVRGWAMPALLTVEQCVASGETVDPVVADLANHKGCQMWGYLEGPTAQPHIHTCTRTAKLIFFASDALLTLSPLQPVPTPYGGGCIGYYCKIVPTTYSHLTSLSPLTTNQYSVTEHYRVTAPKEGQGLPGVFFFYELSPIMVAIEERRMGLLHFLTQLCAILGGVFTVAGMVDRLVYSSLKHWEKKMTQGKLA